MHRGRPERAERGAGDGTGRRPGGAARRRLAALAAGAALAGVPAGAARAQGAGPCAGATAEATSRVFEQGGTAYQVYRNDRTGFRIAWPVELLVPLPPPREDDGRAFVALDGSARVLAYGAAFGGLEPDLAAVEARFASERGVRDRAAGEGWFELRGLEGEEAFLLRVEARDDGTGYRAVEIHHPVGASDLWGPVRREVADSLDAWTPAGGSGADGACAPPAGERGARERVRAGASPAGPGRPA